MKTGHFTRAIAMIVFVIVSALALASPALAVDHPTHEDKSRAAKPRVRLAPVFGDAVCMLGLDTSQRITAAGYRAIAAGGYSFVGRYLEITKAGTGAPANGGKVYFLTKAELDSARAAGVGVVLIFEWCDGRLHLPNSYSAGARDAAIALKARERLGLPFFH